MPLILWQWWGGAGTLVAIIVVPLVFVFPRIGRCSPVAILIAPLSTPLSPCRRRRHSTHDPPHEQLLVRLGAGGASLLVIRS
jgi:hypothetical protein